MKTKRKDIHVLVCGAAGKMGQSVIKAVTAEAGMKIVAAVDRAGNPRIGTDIGTVCGIKEIGVHLSGDLKEAISQTQPDILVDFTMPEIVFVNAQIALKAGVRVVIGTTGMSKDDIS